MMFGFQMSRAVLSMSMIVFGINALRDVNPRHWFRNKWWLLGVCWVAIYTLTYFWSANKGYWDVRWQVKLPVLILPLSFAFLPQFSVKQLKIFTIFTAVLLLGGACESSSFLVHNGAYYAEQYRTAKVLPTLAYNDHVRFSLAVALFIIWCVYFWQQMQGRIFKWFIGIIMLLLTIYLHILAAKTGLVTLYMFFIGWGIYLLIAKRKIAGAGVILALIIFVGFAVNYIPTLHERIGYMSFTYIKYKEGDKSGAYGDIGRFISYDIALKIIRQHPWGGVGAGDMLDEMKKGYDQWYPAVQDEERLLPHNQFLTVALGCGIPAALLFALWVFVPLTWLKRNRESFFFFIVWLAMLLQLMIEPVLEVQTGVFVYLFFLLWQKHTLKTGRVETV
jgi:O-antigen ligase